MCIESLHEVSLSENSAADRFTQVCRLYLTWMFHALTFPSLTLQRVRCQLKLLRELDHSNIVSFQGWEVEAENETLLRASVISAGCVGGDVMSYLRIRDNADRLTLVLFLMIYHHRK